MCYSKYYQTTIYINVCELLPHCIHRIGIAATGVGESGDAFCECRGIGFEFALKHLLAVYENRDCALGVKETLVKENAQLAVG